MDNYVCRKAPEPKYYLGRKNEHNQKSYKSIDFVRRYYSYDEEDKRKNESSYQAKPGKIYQNNAGIRRQSSLVSLRQEQEKSE